MTNTPTTSVAAAMEQGRAAFNRGEFFLAHELWEQAWRDLAAPERTIVQGLIQIAAGCHHLQNQRPGPAARLIAKGTQKLLGDDSPPFLAAMPLHAFALRAQHLIIALNTPGAPPPDPATLTL